MNTDNVFKNSGYIISNPNYNPKTKKGRSQSPTLHVIGVDDAGGNGAADAFASNVSDMWTMGDTSKYQRYGITPNRISPNLDKELADAQSNWAKAGNALAQTVISEIGLGTALGITDLFDMIGSKIGLLDNDYKNPVSDFLEKKQEEFREFAPIYTTPGVDISNGGLTDFGWWMSNMPSIASSLTLLIPSTGVTKGLSWLGKATKATSFTRKAVRATTKAIGNKNLYRWANKASTVERANAMTELGINAALSRTMENYQEARGVYNDMYAEAVDKLNNLTPQQYQQYIDNNPHIFKDENGNDKIDTSDRDAVAKFVAKESADRDFLQNYWNIGWDMLQLYGLKNMFRGGKLPELGSSKAKVRRAHKDMMKYADKLKGTNAAEVAEEIKELNKSLPFMTKLGHKIEDYTYGNAMTIGAEASEGAEEAWNYISQMEGMHTGRLLLGTDKPSRWDNRFDDYITSPQLWESAFWGVLGGVVFQNVGGLFKQVGYNISKHAEDKKAAKQAETTGETKLSPEWSLFDDMPDVKRGIESVYARQVNLMDLKEKQELIKSGKNPYDSSKEITKEEAPIYEKMVSDDYITNLALQSYNNGTFDMTREYFANDNVRKGMVENGVISEEDSHKFQQDILAKLDKTKRQYEDETVRIDSLSGESNRKENIPMEYIQIAATHNVKTLNNIEDMTERQAALIKEFDDAFAAIPDGKIDKNLPYRQMMDFQVKVSYLNKLEDDKRKIEEQHKTDPNIGTQVALDNVNKRIDNVKKELAGDFSNERASYTMFALNELLAHKRTQFREIDANIEKVFHDLENGDAKAFGKYFGNEEYNPDKDTIDSIIQEYKQLGKRYDDVMTNLEQLGTTADSYRNAVMLGEFINEQNSNMIATRKEFDNYMNVLNNTMNEARIKAVDEAVNNITSLTDKYDLDTIDKIILANRNGESIDDLTSNFEEGDKAKLNEALSVINFSNQANLGIYEDIKNNIIAKMAQKAIDEGNASAQAKNAVKESSTSNLNPSESTENKSSNNQSTENVESPTQEENKQPANLQQSEEQPQTENQFIKVTDNGVETDETQDTADGRIVQSVDEETGEVTRTIVPKDDTEKSQSDYYKNSNLFDYEDGVSLIDNNYKVQAYPTLDNDGNLIKGRIVKQTTEGEAKAPVETKEERPSTGGLSVEPESQTSTTIDTLRNIDFDKLKSMNYIDRYNFLKSNGLLTEHHGIVNGREFVVANINGVLLPFYKSSSGTDGKHKNQWYPFFGVGTSSSGEKGNWLIKGDIPVMERGYDVEEIKLMQDTLNAAFPYKHGEKWSPHNPHQIFGNNAIGASELNKLLFNTEDPNVQNGVNAQAHITNYINRIKEQDNKVTEETPTTQSFDAEQFTHDVQSAFAGHVDYTTSDEDINKVADAIKAKIAEVRPEIKPEYVNAEVDKYVEQLKKAFDKVRQFKGIERAAGNLNAVAQTESLAAKVEETDTTDYSPMFTKAMDTFVQEYAKTLIVPYSEGKQIINMQDILRICQSSYGDNSSQATNLYNLCKAYLLSEDGQKKYVIEDLDEVNKDTVVENSFKNPITRQTEFVGGFYSARVDIKSFIDLMNNKDITSDADRKAYFDVIDKLQPGDKVKLYAVNDELIIKGVNSNGKEITIGRMPKPTTIDDGKYIAFNEGWGTDVKIGPNGEVQSELRDLFKSIFLNDGSNEVLDNLRQIIVDASINGINNKYLDAFQNNRLISKLVSDSFREKDFYRRKVYIDKEGNADYRNMLNHLVKLWRFCNISDAKLNIRNNATNINVGLNLWFNKMYNSYNNITGVTDNQEVTISKITEGKMHRKLAFVTEENKSELPHPKEGIKDLTSARIAVVDPQDSTSMLISGREHISSNGWKVGSTIMTVFNRNGQPDFVKAIGVNFDANENNASIKKIGNAITKELQRKINNFFVDGNLNELEIFFNNLVRNKGNAGVVPILAAKNTIVTVGQQSVHNNKTNTNDHHLQINFYDKANNTNKWIRIYNVSFGNTKARKIITSDGFRFDYNNQAKSSSGNPAYTIISLLQSLCNLNIDAEGIKMDNQTESSNTGFITKKDGKIHLDIGDENGVHEEYDSYNDFLVNNDFIRVNTFIDDNGSNYDRTSDVQGASQNMYIDIPMSTTQTSTSQQAKGSTERIERGTDKAKYDNLKASLESDSTAKGEDLMRLAFGDEWVNRFNEEAKTDGIFESLFPSKIYYDDINWYSDNGVKGAIARTNSRGNNSTYDHIFRDGRKTIRIHGKGNTVVGSRLLNMLASKDSFRRNTGARKLIHERIHQILAEPSIEKLNALFSIADIYKQVKSALSTEEKYIKTLDANDAKNKARITLFNDVKKTLSYKDGDIALEEFIVESMTNSSVAKFMDDIKVSDVGEAKGETLLSKIMKFIAKFFGWNISDNSLLRKEFNILSNLDGTPHNESQEEVTKEIHEDNKSEDEVEPTNPPVEESPVIPSETPEIREGGEQILGDLSDDAFDEFNLDEDTYEANVEESNLYYETLTDNQTHVNSLPHLIHSLDENNREDMQKLVDSGWASIKCS